MDASFDPFKQSLPTRCEALAAIKPRLCGDQLAFGVCIEPVGVSTIEFHFLLQLTGVFGRKGLLAVRTGRAADDTVEPLPTFLGEIADRSSSQLLVSRCRQSVARGENRITGWRGCGHALAVCDEAVEASLKSGSRLLCLPESATLPLQPIQRRPSHQEVALACGQLLIQGGYLFEFFFRCLKCCPIR